MRDWLRFTFTLCTVRRRTRGAPHYLSGRGRRDGEGAPASSLTAEADVGDLPSALSRAHSTPSTPCIMRPYVSP
jgi:hypothetical protein